MGADPISRQQDKPPPEQPYGSPLFSVLVDLIPFALVSGAFWLVLQLEFVARFDEAVPWAMKAIMVGVGIVGFVLFSLRRKQPIASKQPTRPFSLLLSFVFVCAASTLFGLILLTGLTDELGFARPVFLLCVPIIVAVGLYIWRLFLLDLYQRLNPQNAMREPAVTGSEYVGIDDTAGDKSKPAGKRE